MAERYPFLVLAPIVGAIANMVAHLVISRIKKGRKYIVSLITGFVCGFFCMLMFTLFAYSPVDNIFDFLAYIIIDAITYTTFSYGYFHYININVASLRIRILHEISGSTSGLMGEEILHRYSTEHTIDNRLKRLLNSDQLVERNGCYFLGRKRTFLALFWLFEVLKHIVLGRGNRLLPATDQESLSVRSMIRLFWRN